MSTPKSETPKSETLKSETPKSETPKSVTPKSETPKSVTPKSETPKSVTPKSETPKSATIQPKSKIIVMKGCPNPACSCNQCQSSGRYIYSVFHSIMSIVAIYLSFRCNKGFNISSFILALCCPYVYIIYILATKGTCGVIQNEPLF